MQKGLSVKTLILYATKHGATKEIAKRIAAQMEGAVLHNLAQPVPRLEDFDCVVIGSSVYAGSIRKEAKAFLAKNASEVTGKTLGLFLSCFSPNENFFTKNFPAQLLQTAKAKAFLGGAFNPEIASGIERFITKTVTKQKGHIDRIDEGKIKEFALKLIEIN